MSTRFQTSLWLWLLLQSLACAQPIPLELISSSPGAAPALALGAVPIPRSLGWREADTLRVVDQNQKTIPAAIQILARYPPGTAGPGPARWIHLKIPTRLAPSGPLWLARKEASATAASPSSPFTLDAAQGLVKEGNLSLQLGTQEHLLRSLQKGGLRFPLEARLYLIDEQGRQVVFHPGRPAVEEQSSVHLRLFWQAPLGPALEATLRLTLAREVPWIQVQVRIENPGAYRKEHAYFKALILELTPGGDLDSGWDGYQRRALPFTLDMPASPPPTLKRPGVLRWSLRGQGTLQRGLDHGGVVGLSSARRTLLVSLLYAARENPTRFRLESDRLQVALLPRGGSGPHFGGRYGKPGKTGWTDPKSLQGYRFEAGMWKSFDVGLWPLAGPGKLADLQALRDAMEHPPLMAASSTKGFPGASVGGFVLPVWSGKKAPLAEQRYRRMLRILVDDRAADPLGGGLGQIGLPAFLARGGTFGGWNPYGWFNFGDITWSQGYCSLHYDWPRTMLASFLATPRQRRFFDWGRKMARHQRDIGTIHSAPPNPWRGAQRYEKGWWHGNSFQPSTSHQWLSGLLLYTFITGDPSTLEALHESRQWILARHLGHWSGLYGARVVGWPVDNLCSLWLLNGDPRLAREINAILTRFQDLEQQAGGHGYVLNKAWHMVQKKLPARMQSWMHAILLASAARWCQESGEKRFVPLVARMAHFLLEQTYLPSHQGPRGFIPARVLEFWAPGGYRFHTSMHLGWVLLDAFARAALLLHDARLQAAADDLFASLTRFHQWSAKGRPVDPKRPATYSPISARMLEYPGSESKILGNIGRFGMSYLPCRRAFLRQKGH